MNWIRHREEMGKIIAIDLPSEIKSSRNFTVQSWNCSNLTWSDGLAQVRLHTADIFCLQESRIDWTKEGFTVEHSQNFLVSTSVRNTISVRQNYEEEKLTDFPVVWLEFPSMSGRVTLINVYVTSETSAASIKLFLGRIPSRCLLVGDFNSPGRTCSTSSNQQSSRGSALDAFFFEDTCPLLIISSEDHTFYRNEYSSRIDLTIISPGLTAESSLDPTFFLDHV